MQWLISRFISSEESKEEEKSVGKIETADSLANIKRGGLILPNKKRLNIRKRPSDDSSRSRSNDNSDDDEANNAPASKIREMQLQQHLKALQSEQSSARKRRHDVEMESDSENSAEKDESCSAAGMGNIVFFPKNCLFFRIFFQFFFQIMIHLVDKNDNFPALPTPRRDSSVT